MEIQWHTLKCHRISFELLSEVFVIHWERFETLWTPFGIQWRSSEIPSNANDVCKCNGNSLGVEETVGNSQAIPWNSKKHFQSLKTSAFDGKHSKSKDNLRLNGHPFRWRTNPLKPNGVLLLFNEKTSLQFHATSLRFNTNHLIQRGNLLISEETSFDIQLDVL